MKGGRVKERQEGQTDRQTYEPGGRGEEEGPEERSIMSSEVT